MRIDDDARLYLTWEARANVDLADATITLKVDDATHALAWVTPATEAAGRFTRRARTAAMFTGSNVAPTGTDVALEPGRHRCEAILTLPDGQIVPARPFILTVA